MKDEGKCMEIYAGKQQRFQENLPKEGLNGISRTVYECPKTNAI